LKKVHILNLGNPRKVKQNLSGILEQPELEKIEAEIVANTTALYRLGSEFLSFALKQSPLNWRQKISRLYYAAYNVSRAIRLFVSGEYSSETEDHKRFHKLPDDFPDKDQYANQLSILREDRNMCDYDHTCVPTDLVLDDTKSTFLVTKFLGDAKSYLEGRGLKL
jgi:hypothetical protein